MMNDRLIDLINWFGTSERKRFAEFAEKTGIERETVKNLYHQRQRINQDHITAIAKAFPKYKMWFVFGEIHPELGQISPELEDTRKAYNG